MDDHHPSATDSGGQEAVLVLKSLRRAFALSPLCVSTSNGYGRPRQPSQQDALASGPGRLCALVVRTFADTDVSILVTRGALERNRHLTASDALLTGFRLEVP